MKSKNISFHLFPPEGPGGPSTEGVGPSVGSLGSLPIICKMPVMKIFGGGI